MPFWTYTRHHLSKAHLTEDCERFAPAYEDTITDDPAKVTCPICNGEVLSTRKRPNTASTGQKLARLNLGDYRTKQRVRHLIAMSAKHGFRQQRQPLGGTCKRSIMKDVIKNAKKRISSNGGKLSVIELGVLAVEHGLSFRFLVEMLEANHVIPCGTYEAISFDLTDSEIMQAAEHRIERDNLPGSVLVGLSAR